MDNKKLKEAALRLEVIANKYTETDKDVYSFFCAICPLIERAKEGSITSPPSHVPGGYWFKEKRLGDYPDLEEAYANFKLLLISTEEQTTKLEELLKKL